MTEDPTAMSKEEFYAMLDEREEAYARGEYSEMLPGETLTEPSMPFFSSCPAISESAVNVLPFWLALPFNNNTFISLGFYL
jgi:hypothetical protein